MSIPTSKNDTNQSDSTAQPIEELQEETNNNHNIPSVINIKETNQKPYQYDKDIYNILIVDDSEDSILLMKLALKSLPYKVDTAENGAVAVEKFKRNSYNLVLMDVQMPIMNGYIATQLIREWERENSFKMTPIVAITANSFIGARERSLDMGCNDHLAKPVEQFILIDTVKKYTYFSIYYNLKK